MNKSITFCLAAFFCLCQLSAQVPDALGVQLYSFRNEMKADLRGTLKKVQDMGFHTVETGLFTGKTAAESKKLLDEFGLTKLRGASAMALSGGERRRCEIARALAATPSIMLLDEPFAGIDPISIADIRDLVKDLKQRQIGVLITDHNVRETLDIVDRACIIYGGQVLFAGSPEALVADENVRRLYLGEGFTL